MFGIFVGTFVGEHDFQFVVRGWDEVVMTLNVFRLTLGGFSKTTLDAVGTIVNTGHVQQGFN